MLPRHRRRFHGTNQEMVVASEMKNDVLEAGRPKEVKADTLSFMGGTFETDPQDHYARPMDNVVGSRRPTHLVYGLWASVREGRR